MTGRLSDVWMPDLPIDVVEALQECEAYFDNRADAEYFTDSPYPKPNEEMRLLVMVREVLRKAGV